MSKAGESEPGGSIVTEPSAEESLCDRVVALATLSSPEVERLVHELDGRRTELEKQNAALRQKLDSVASTARRQAGDSLPRSEQFPEQNPNPVLRVSADGALLYANAPARGCLTTFGWQAGDRVPESFYTLAAAALRRDDPIEVEIGNPAGSTFWFSAVQPPGEDYVNLYGRNVTSRKQAEEALRRSEERYRRAAAEWEQTFDSVPDLIAVLDREHRVVRANRAMADRLGVTTRQCRGATCYRVVHGQDHPPTSCPHSRVLTERRECVAEVHEDSLGGYFLVSCTPLIDTDGEIIGSVHVARDITERKRWEEALQWSARRNELLSTTAARLLESDNPQDLVEELCRQVMELVDCHAFFNFLIDERAGRLRLNASAGIPQDEVRQIEWLDMGVAVCGCVARDRERIVAEDIQNTSDPRTALVKSYGIQAYCCHPLKVQDRLIGTLSFGTRSRPHFTPEQIEVMKAVTDLVAMAMHRIRTEHELRQSREEILASLAEKEVLLKEIHHRVKNNMQVISSLVGLQADQLPDPAVRAVLQDVTHRVRSMALVHERLYHSPDMARVEFAEYARSLLDYLWRAHGTAASRIRLAPDLEPVSLSVNAAVPCGLILNELVSNALKHAFRDRAAAADGSEVGVSLRADPKGQVCLRVRDNGAGLPAGLDWRQSRSLGLHLVQMLAGQLHAAVDVATRHGEGTEVQVVFEGSSH